MSKSMMKTAYLIIITTNRITNINKMPKSYKDNEFLRGKILKVRFLTTFKIVRIKT